MNDHDDDVDEEEEEDDDDEETHHTPVQVKMMGCMPSSCAARPVKPVESTQSADNLRVSGPVMLCSWNVHRAIGGRPTVLSDGLLPRVLGIFRRCPVQPSPGAAPAEQQQPSAAPGALPSEEQPRQEDAESPPPVSLYLVAVDPEYPPTSSDVPPVCFYVQQSAICDIRGDYPGSDGIEVHVENCPSPLLFVAPSIRIRDQILEALLLLLPLKQRRVVPGAGSGIGSGRILSVSPSRERILVHLSDAADKVADKSKSPALFILTETRLLLQPLPAEKTAPADTQAPCPSDATSDVDTTSQHCGKNDSMDVQLADIQQFQTRLSQSGQVCRVGISLADGQVVRFRADADQWQKVRNLFSARRRFCQFIATPAGDRFFGSKAVFDNDAEASGSPAPAGR